jgi:hypothetical protein
MASGKKLGRQSYRLQLTKRILKEVLPTSCDEDLSPFGHQSMRGRQTDSACATCDKNAFVS